jgi:hypothetical protein
MRKAIGRHLYGQFGGAGGAPQARTLRATALVIGGRRLRGMDTERFVETLDNYLAVAGRPPNDPERRAARELLRSELERLPVANGLDAALAAEDRITQRTKGVRKNPLNKFLDLARPRMMIAWSAAAQQKIAPAQYESFTLNGEERNFAEDVVARAEQLSHAFDRLCQLGVEHFEINELMKRNQRSPQAIDLSLVNPSVLEREERWRREVDMVTSFAHYEIKSVVDMLKQWGIKVNTPEIQYVMKTRDRFLVHPHYGGVMRMARRSFAIPFDGGPAQASVTGLNSWGPITRDHYLKMLNMTPPIDDNKERLGNEQILLSVKRNQELSEAEIVRLKAFGLRDPDLPKALAELADILGKSALPKIEATFQEAVTAFGFQRCP